MRNTLVRDRTRVRRSDGCLACGIDHQEDIEPKRGGESCRAGGTRGPCSFTRWRGRVGDARFRLAAVAGMSSLCGEQEARSVVDGRKWEDGWRTR